jgi:uncharacterized protein (DUF2267 family)
MARAVAERTGLSREEAADLSWAVLEGLADQLSEGEAKRLAADFPTFPGLADQSQPSGRRTKEAHPLKVDEFIRRVSEHTGLPDDEATAGIRAVLGTLRDSLSADAYGHLVGQLPVGYTELAENAR